MIWKAARGTRRSGQSLEECSCGSTTIAIERRRKAIGLTNETCAYSARTASIAVRIVGICDRYFQTTTAKAAKYPIRLSLIESRPSRSCSFNTVDSEHFESVRSKKRSNTTRHIHGRHSSWSGAHIRSIEVEPATIARRNRGVVLGENQGLPIEKGDRKSPKRKGSASDVDGHIGDRDRCCLTLNWNGHENQSNRHWNQPQARDSFCHRCLDLPNYHLHIYLSRI